MAGYRCVNYYDLCRLCTASQGNKVSVFSDEGRAKGLQGKIVKGLNINVDENDKLPKTICTSCVQQVEQISEYKDSCDQAQALLAGCIDSAKLRNGGQVYIRDGPPKKPIVEPPQQQMTPTFTITATPKANTQPTNVATVTANTNTNDFLSSIIQAVGIQAQEEVQEIQQHQQQQQQPQYTLTIDGQTIKASPIQYKITETTPTYIQPQQIADENAVASNLVNEFLKLKDKKRDSPAQMTIDFTSAASAAIKKAQADAKAKKPKINFVLSSPPKQTQQQIPITMTTTAAAAPQTTPNKVSLQQIFQSNKAVVPIVIKADGSIETSNQLLSQIAAAQQAVQQVPVQQQQPEIKITPQPQPQQTQQQQQQAQYNPQHMYVQLKIQPNADGQPTVQLTPAVPQLQLSQSSFQNLNLQQQIQQQIQQQVAQLTAQATQQQQQQQQQQPQTAIFHQAPQQQQQTMQPHTISISAPQHAQIIQQQTPQHQVSVDTQVTQQDIADMDDHMDTSGMDSEPELAPPPQQQQQTQQIIVHHQQQQQQQTQQQKMTNKPKMQQQQVKIKAEPVQENASVPTTADSVMASLQMQMITSLKHEGPDPPTNLTTCDVCKKIFKRKEHLMQHLKSHIGLRPFKCDEVGCNKAFSRKEHLMRHIVSHTGKKMFSCELCHKFFSRKDNLNKHRRTHPEVAGDNAPFSCEICDKKFTVKTAYSQHKLTHEQGGGGTGGESTEENSDLIKITSKKDQQGKKQVKVKQEIDHDNQLSHQITTITVPSSQPQQIKLQQQNPQQETTHQISQLGQPIQIQMSQAGQPAQILQLPLQSIVSSAANQITYNQTTTQSTKTTYFKAVSSGDGNAQLYPIPSNIILQNPTFITTATGELQVASGFKIENN